MKDIILFDLDDTILDFKATEKMAFTNMMADARLEADEKLCERYSEINQSLWKKLEVGQITREKLLAERFRIFFSELNFDYPAEKANEIYMRYLSGGVFFVEGAIEMLEKYSKTSRLFLVTNGTASMQHPRIKKAGLAKYFENIFISQEIGFNKPDKKYFDCCFSQIKDFDKNKCVIVGDSLTSDIAGGINMGIKTVWFNKYQVTNESDIVPDVEITNLGELYNIL